MSTPSDSSTERFDSARKRAACGRSVASSCDAWNLAIVAAASLANATSWSVSASAPVSGARRLRPSSVCAMHHASNSSWYCTWGLLDAYLAPVLAMSSHSARTVRGLSTYVFHEMPS